MSQEIPLPYRKLYSEEEYREIASLIFQAAACLDQYINEFGNIPICTIDYEIKEYAKILSQINKKFVSGEKLTKDKIEKLREELREVVERIEELYLQRLSE